jgi:hypothetical protein
MTYRVPTVVAGTSGASSGSSLSITKPSTLRAGDLIILCVATESAAKPIKVPTGFVPIIDEINQGSGVNLRCWYHWVTNTESASYSVTFAGTDDIIYNLFAIRGVNAFNAVNVTDTRQGSSSLPISEPGITTTVDNCLAVTVLALNDSPMTLTSPTGWTEIMATDGLAGSISVGIASKTIATAGTSGLADWTGASGETDYASVTFAVEPGVMSLEDSVLFASQQLLANTLADCSEFRNLVGVSSHSAALAKIWHEALPPPANGKDNYTLAELQAYRPFALIFTNDPQGPLSNRQAASPGAYFDSGTLRVLFEVDVPAEFKNEPLLLDHLIKQAIGRIIARPSDEASTFNGLRNLFHATTSDYSYLAGDSVTFRGYHRSSQKEQPGQGDFVFAFLDVTYGQRGA